jgi:hypothetical protein
MNRQEKQALSGFRQVRDFLDQHAVEVRVANIKAHRDALHTIVEQLTSFGVQQEASYAEAAVTAQARRDLRVRLQREFFSPVRHLTRRLSSSNPDLHDVLRVRPSYRIEGKLASARAIAAAARADAESFASSGLAPDFGAQLEQLIADIQKTTDARERSRAVYAGAVAGAREVTSRGRFVVGLLDRLLKPVLAPLPVLRAEWRAARRAAAAPSGGGEREAPPSAAVAPIGDAGQARAA